jgi:hypothetical protein
MPTDPSISAAVDQPAVEQSSETQSTPQATWHRPTLTRIDIKRTMLGSGPFTDGEIPSITSI